MPSYSKVSQVCFSQMYPHFQQRKNINVFFKVQLWLEKLFGDKPVPAYELNEHTVTVLHSLMRRNEQKERDTQLLVEDLRQKADEYNAEGTVF